VSGEGVQNCRAKIKSKKKDYLLSKTRLDNFYAKMFFVFFVQNLELPPHTLPSTPGSTFLSNQDLFTNGTTNKVQSFRYQHFINTIQGSSGHERMVVGFTTTYEISAYRH
jgi:hypothetical protein